MYDRRYESSVLSFEPSGGLMNAALVMRDKETDSWWSIMTGNAIGGDLEGTPLVEFPASEKTTWVNWRTRYPQTMVLSVDGKEHFDHNPYEGYFASTEGFRGLETEDKRLPGKEPVYAFTLDGKPYAATHAEVEGGVVFKVGNTKEVFLYRATGASVFASTAAYVAEIEGDTGRFIKTDEKWFDSSTGAEFSKEAGFPTADGTSGSVGDESKKSPPRRLNGFDTFWYVWSRTHKDVHLVGRE
ncbi:MAG: DUF3179 domain-containing protein [Candidatus Latescibacterota bacterium]|nr:MAG: DUF3179 domain-containing protein [Candidatus Latescibacterota bacterium]